MFGYGVIFHLKINLAGMMWELIWLLKQKTMNTGQYNVNVLEKMLI